MSTSSRRRRSRRSTEEESHNRERWLVSYGDFITLLFAFFVVMYSVSSVNDGKYKVLSETLQGVFNASQRSITPIEVAENIAYQQPEAGRENRSNKEISPIGVAPRGGEGNIRVEINRLKAVSQEFNRALRTLLTDGLVSINENDDWIEISFKEKILFVSGQAEPIYEAFPVMEKIAEVLKGTKYSILVEGFTDNRPIASSKYPTNWELSSARATAIIRLLANSGVAPSRMAAVGYGSTQPIASNRTRAGRQKNRRVVILISREPSTRVVFRR